MKKSSVWHEFKQRSKHLMYGVAGSVLTFMFGKTSRRYVVSFGPKEVPPHTTVTVDQLPQVYFRGMKIINTGDDEGLFIQGLFVGNKPQLPTFQSAIAVKCYGSQVLDNELELDICAPTLPITFQVQNTSGTPKFFSTSIFGTIDEFPFMDLLAR